MERADLVERFQCPGCVAGPNPATCPAYRPDDDASGGFVQCAGHVPGTRFGLGPNSLVALGLPRGFNKVGMRHPRHPGEPPPPPNIRLWTAGHDPGWNHLNVPVWGYEEDGFLYVRTFLPRLGEHYVDVIEGGRFADLPAGVIDVAAFRTEID